MSEGVMEDDKVAQVYGSKEVLHLVDHLSGSSALLRTLGSRGWRKVTVSL